VGATCATAIVLASAILGGTQALADPISDAQKKLDQLEAQRSQIEDKYNESRQRLTDAQTKKNELTTDVAQQQAQLDALKPTIVWIVTLERQSAGVNMTATFLLDDSETGFLAQMSTMASVTNLIDEQVARYVSEQQRLNDLQTSLSATIATMQTEVDAQKQMLADAQAKENQQQEIVNRLNAQQQAALAARQAKDNPVPVIDQGKASAKAMKVVEYALKQNGKRYVFGTAGPNTFDCSGLAMAAYAQVGISLPHNARTQAYYGKQVSRSNLVPGDLLFFYFPISHVGIYIGNGMMIHASNSRTGVIIAPVESSFNTARRLV